MDEHIIKEFAVEGFHSGPDKIIIILYYKCKYILSKNWYYKYKEIQIQIHIIKESAVEGLHSVPDTIMITN